jgi:phage-related protein
VTSRGSRTRIRWEGDSLEVIRRFPRDIRANLGNDLQRLDLGEAPLDYGSMGKVLPGVYELRDRDAERWYRVLYIAMKGWIFVLHCFTKKSNQTPQRDIETARLRLAALKKRITEEKKRVKLETRNK